MDKYIYDENNGSILGNYSVYALTASTACPIKIE